MAKSAVLMLSLRAPRAHMADADAPAAVTFIVAHALTENRLRLVSLSRWESNRLLTSIEFTYTIGDQYYKVVKYLTLKLHV